MIDTNENNQGFTDLRFLQCIIAVLESRCLIEGVDEHRIEKADES